MEIEKARVNLEVNKRDYSKKRTLWLLKKRNFEPRSLH